MAEMKQTQYFKVQPEKEMQAADIIERVYAALVDKGYNPVSQIVGYIMSGDPTYITSHEGARSLIMKAERDEILEELLQFYIDEKLNKGEPAHAESPSAMGRPTSRDKLGTIKGKKS